MKNDPLISVIMTVYNTDRSFVRDAIKSVIRQSYSNIELLIVDDASDDPELISYCKEFAEQEIERQRRGRRQLKIISSKKNYGTYVCRNYAISVATGEYIAIHDSDDTASVSYIKSLYRYYTQNEKTAKAVYCMTNDRAGNKSGVICSASSFFKKTLIDEMGYFDSVRFAADTEFRLRCQRLHGRGSVKILNKLLYNARITKTSLTGSESIGFQSKPRWEYVQAFKKFHKTGRHNLICPFPVVERHFPVPSLCTTPPVDLNDFIVIANTGENVHEHFYFDITPEHTIDNKTISKNPLVSVIMSAYNSSKEIGDAIDSVMTQSYKNVELIIVDDCSRDNTVSVVKHYIEKYPDKRIILLQNEQNVGTYVSRNRAITVSSGEYITGHDADDTCDSHYIHHLMQPHLNGQRGIKISAVEYQSRAGKNKSAYCYISQCFNKSLISDIGYFDSVRFGADGEFRMRCEAIYGARSIHLITKRVTGGFLYHAREGGLTSASSTGFKSTARAFYAKKFREWHKSHSKGRLKSSFREFPLADRPFKVHPLSLVKSDWVALPYED